MQTNLATLNCLHLSTVYNGMFVEQSKPAYRLYM